MQSLRILCRAKPFGSITLLLINVLKDTCDTARGLKTTALLPVCNKDLDYQHRTPVMRSVLTAPYPIHAGVKERSLSLLKNGPRAKVELLNERRVFSKKRSRPLRISALLDVSMF